jgi:hypothetical protein
MAIFYSSFGRCRHYVWARLFTIIEFVPEEGRMVAGPLLADRRKVRAPEGRVVDNVHRP